MTIHLITKEVPKTGFLRLKQVLEIIPVGATNWWQGCKSGRFPKPVKLTLRTTAWKIEDIRALIESYNKKESEEKGGSDASKQYIPPNKRVHQM